MMACGVCCYFACVHLLSYLRRTSTYLTIYVLLLIYLEYLRPVASLRFCYFRRNATLRTNIAKFQIKDIDFTLCTHYVYCYANVDYINKTIAAQVPVVEEGPTGLYRQFVIAKIKFPSIKTMVSLGGYSLEAERRFKYLELDNTLLLKVASSAVPFLRHRGFDGMEVDWQTYNEANKNAHARLLKALREKFDEEVTSSKLILTTTGSGRAPDISANYDINKIAETVDYVILRTHELYLSYVLRTSFASPLFTTSSHPVFRVLSLNASLHIWNMRGMPFNKMVVGFTGIGRYLELANVSNYHADAPTTQTILRGHLYNITSGLAYPEICLIRNASVNYFDEYCKSAYLVHGNRWVGYDDRDSLTYKHEWATHQGVAGFMFAGLDEDDFTGTMCGEGRYPLLLSTKNFVMSEVTTPGVNKETTPDVNKRSTPDVNKRTTPNVNKVTTPGANKPWIFPKKRMKENSTTATNSIAKYLLYPFVFTLGCLFGFGVVHVWGQAQSRSL